MLRLFIVRAVAIIARIREVCKRQQSTPIDFQYSHLALIRSIKYSRYAVNDNNLSVECYYHIHIKERDTDYGI